MGLRFAETMRGHAEVAGRRRAFEFSLEVLSPRMVLACVDAPVVGHATLEGLTAVAPITSGLMRIGLPLRRSLGYELEFPASGSDGGRWVFRGQKTVRVLQLRHTMTHLVGELTGPDGERGPAELTFDLSELGAFLGSFRFCLGRPAPSAAMAKLTAGSAEGPSETPTDSEDLSAT